MITNKFIQNEKVLTIINSDYKDVELISVMRDIITRTIESNSYYKEQVAKYNYNVENLNTIDDLAEIPYLTTAIFKESAGMFRTLLKIPENSPEFKTWNVSSCTTGDSSLVGRSVDDIELLASMTIKCIFEFIPIPKDEWGNTISFNFSPSVKFLNRIALRYTEVRPVALYSSNLHKISTRMSDPYFLIKFYLLKAIKEIIKKRSLVGAFGINSKFVLEKVKENSEKPRDQQKHISFGGSLQLLNNFMNAYMKENNAKFDLPESVVNTGGGGWSGHKSQLKYPPIEKEQFVSDCIESFGTTADKITDMYGFTETPVIFGSHWSDKHNDFIFHCPSQARILVRDLNTLDPLNNVGDRGFLEVLTPFGVDTSVNHAILVDDYVELVSKYKCSECGYEGATFKIQGRIEDKEGLGCSSLVEWI
jgi:hypothetical protein